MCRLQSWHVVAQVYLNRFPQKSLGLVYSPREWYLTWYSLGLKVTLQPHCVGFSVGCLPVESGENEWTVNSFTHMELEPKQVKIQSDLRKKLRRYIPSSRMHPLSWSRVSWSLWNTSWTRSPLWPLTVLWSPWRSRRNSTWVSAGSIWSSCRFATSQRLDASWVGNPAPMGIEIGKSSNYINGGCSIAMLTDSQRLPISSWNFLGMLRKWFLKKQ